MRASVASGAKPLPDIEYIFIVPLSNGGHHNARAKFGTVGTGNNQAFIDGTTSLLTTWPPSHPETSLDQWLQNNWGVVWTIGTSQPQPHSRMAAITESTRRAPERRLFSEISYIDSLVMEQRKETSCFATSQLPGLAAQMLGLLLQEPAPTAPSCRAL